MTIETINVEEAVANVRRQMEKTNLDPAMQSALEIMFLLVSILVRRLGLNSKNSSKPPSQDPYRSKKPKKGKGKKRGGQTGHAGATLQQTDDPDDVVDLPMDRSTLSQGE